MKCQRAVSQRLIFSDTFIQAVQLDPMTLVDVGARGAAQEPWASMDPRSIRVIGFEPDPEECERLRKTQPANHVYLPVGLWSGDSEQPFHLAQTPSCSSIHPPHWSLL